ncbi:hypothetical protein AAEX63_04660 [Luteococcus sp. H138]|uniref:CdiA C-terminal domain-containing protein n=1 Tax=unclassified Luteococcus TaxID=2639923 RepID=UPI00313E6E85
MKINGEVWEFKSPTDSSLRSTIASQFKRAQHQSPRVVIDLQRCGLPDALAVAQCVRRLQGQKRIRRLNVLDKTRAVAFCGAID